MQTNNTTLRDFLEINDPDITISAASLDEKNKYDPNHKYAIVLHLEKSNSNPNCPICGQRLHSKGFYVKK